MTADLLSIAYRIETEEPSRKLNEDIARVTGWTVERGGYGRNAAGKVHHLPNWLTSIDAAAALMPDGWSVNLYQANGRWSVQAGQADWITERWVTVQAEAPTEPRARTAVALRAIEAEKQE